MNAGTKHVETVEDAQALARAGADLFVRHAVARDSDRGLAKRRPLQISDLEELRGARFHPHETVSRAERLELGPTEFEHAARDSHLVDQAGESVIEAADAVAENLNVDVIAKTGSPQREHRIGSVAVPVWRNIVQKSSG